MAEPTVSIFTAGGAGFAAFVMSAIGIEPQPLFWALIGATLGMSLAAPTGRWRAIAVFLSVVLTSALLGSILASDYFNENPALRNFCSLLVAVFFHPFFSAIVSAVPTIVEAGLSKIGLGGQK